MISKMHNEFIENIIDWKKFDAVSNIDQRLGGVSQESIKIEVGLWQKQIELLTPLDYKLIKKEINAWEIEIPQSLSYYDIASTYSRLVAYKLRVGDLLAESKSWTETCETAIKFLSEYSQSAFSGTGADKKSNANSVVQPFVHLKVQAERLENYLTQMHQSIIFCADQLDLLLKERQSRAKVNMKLGHDGESEFLDSKEEETDEEGWTTITKKAR